MKKQNQKPKSMITYSVGETLGKYTLSGNLNAMWHLEKSV